MESVLTGRVHLRQDYKSPLQPVIRLDDDLTSEYVDISTVYRVTRKPKPLVLSQTTEYSNSSTCKSRTTNGKYR